LRFAPDKSIREENRAELRGDSPAACVRRSNSALRHPGKPLQVVRAHP